MMRGPNMSYCMMENTSLALEQVLDYMNEAYEKNDIEDFFSMSGYELQGFESLKQLCEDFLKIADLLEERKAYLPEHLND